MALGDFVLGKGAQHDSPLENGPSNTRNSRQRAAELARVNVPRTTLNGFKAPTSGPFQRANETRGYSPNARVGVGDMFDTDVEGIDDSTTVTSLNFDKSDSGQAYEGNAPPPREDIRSYAHVDQPLNVTAGRREVKDTYRTVAERMRELDSDPADHNDTGMGFQEAHHMQGVGELTSRGEVDREDIQTSGWNGNYGSDGGPLSWQRIEEVLHENRNRRDNSVAAEVAPIPSPAYREQAFAEERPQAFDVEDAEDDVRYRSTLQSPQPPQKTPTKGRASVRSRFMTPNFQNDRRNSHFGAIPGDSQSFIPRPSSASGVHPSPRSSRRKTITNRTAATASHSPVPQEIRNNHHPYAHGGGGIFDTTDLSALDSLDSPSHQDTFASPHLSSVSTTSSSKRPLSEETKTTETPFTSDYPPNILRTKAFSDLQTESFDYNPAPPQPIFPPQEPALPLGERLSRLKTLTDDQRRALLSGLTLAEWEESGDWLIDQFSIILQKTKTARQERRKIAAVFEAEIKRRYELAESEGKDVRSRLDDMRSGGMGVLKKQNGS